MLNEVFRVLRNGNWAGFTVWGRKDMCKLFTYNEGIYEKQGFFESSKDFKCKSPFHLNDPEALKCDLMEAGFSQVKYWNVASNFPPKSEQLAEELFMNDPPYFVDE